MKHRIIILATVVSLAISASANSPWYSVNYDEKTVSAMIAAYGTEVATEMYYSEQVREILKHYSAAEVVTAGIFASKYLDRKALTNLGIWKSPDENYYYKRIYGLVSAKIMPKIWTVAQQMLHSPHNALYWGSYLFKICQEVETLCMQFETIVTNSSLSFRDLVFLQISPEFQQQFSLTKGGGIDWQGFFDDIASIPSNFTKENLQQDIERLCDMGVSIANAGTENMMGALLGGSSFDDIINGRIPAIINAVESSYAFYKALDENMQGTLLAMVGGPGAVAQLFNLDNYNITSWMTDYRRELMGQYYTQRWYIYTGEAGSEMLCDYNPPESESAIAYGREWFRVFTTTEGYIPSTSVNNSIKALSESYAGWSQSLINQMNAANDGYRYSIEYDRHAYDLKRDGNLYAKAYAYSIKAYRSWSHTEEVYETVFDSYSMDEATFRSRLQAMLAEANSNEDGTVYAIGCDDKRYYHTTDADRLKGTESVIISVTCHDGFTLMQGNTQYKCKYCGATPNAHTKDCAMATTVTESNADTSDIDALISAQEQLVSDLRRSIAELELENRRLVKQIASASISEAAPLREKYNANVKEIDGLKKRLEISESQLAEAQAARNEILYGDSEETDDYYRLPVIMADCKTAFSLQWEDDGHWEGFTFIRKATGGRIKGSSKSGLTFTAKVTIARKPSYVLGIKVHRAIVQIEWSLTGDISDTQTVDVIELDTSASDRDNARLVNERISEVARDYPGCDISTEYIRREPMETDPTDGTYHLLWSSDRLEIARQVETRLSQIYADLVSLEKMMHYRLSIVDMMKEVTPYINDRQGKRLDYIEAAKIRWMQSARGWNTTDR